MRAKTQPQLPERRLADADIVGFGAKLGEELCQSSVGYWAAHGMETHAAEDAAEAMAKHPTYLRWDELSSISVDNPANAVQTWHKLLDFARDELISGHRAATTVEISLSPPVERARFIVLRDELAAEWQPRGGLEWQLIDRLAIAMTMYERAVQTRIEREHTACNEDKRQRDMEWSKNKDRYIQEYGSWVRPRISDDEALERANADIERWDRIVTRNVRLLQNLRRYAVTITSAAQVNVGEQQVNIATQGKSRARRKKPPSACKAPTARFGSRGH